MSDQEKQYTIDQEVVPGTIRLIDVLGNLNVKKNDGDHNIILQPQPTSNINDPLRWTDAKKHFQFFLVWIWCFMFAVTVNFYGPLFDVWVDELNTDFNELGISVAICFLGLGLGVLIVQPTALKVGKRFTYLFCTLLGIAGCVLGAKATSIENIYVYQALGGLGAAPVDSLAEITGTDLYFQHQRSTAFGLVILALYAGSYLGPVACGYVVDGLGWRWCFWIQVVIYAIIFVLFSFTLEETSFRRDLNAEDEFEEEILSQSKDKKKENIKSTSKEVDPIDRDSVDESVPKMTYKQRMRIIHTEYNDVRSWLCIFWRPFFLVSFPAVIWGGLVYGAQMMWLSLIGNSQGDIYGAEPYNFSANGIGLTNLGAACGCITGMFYGGNFVDWSTIKLAERNNGIMEPEFRLYSMVVPTVINAAGLLAYGLGADYGTHWAVSVVIGQGCLGFAMGSTGSICLTYAVDCYHKLASECIVLILFIRNMIGMIFCFVFIPWYVNLGLRVTTWMMFALSIGINGSFIILVKWGKDYRKWTAVRYAKYSNPMFGEIFKDKS
ncbi:ion transporter [Spathaspora passalidarum NRRL Y-27907]|uniref:Ion transporter n=1 Tax=Spathaspora passalidarum (strain NRRL Y-27907 / 11-Y1) TaxID=619300 RepID=G3AHK2_SPAPN|nr:ion transporter [Spathaspora passalidarum NRRL Y-27907]EGW34166.1 ion transporter [Spathaspora passalidarum NRRL Y-27907]